MRDDEIRQEFAGWLRAYLKQRATISDILRFEAEYALNDEISDALRVLLWNVALLGDEAVSGWAPTAAFDDLARETLSKLTPAAAGAEAAAD